MKNKFLEDSLNMTIEKWLYYHQNNVHYKQKYRGLNMIKNPFDLVVYDEILWEVKPTIIIEVGNAFGGFSLWLRDRMKTVIDDNVKVITIDLESTGNDNLETFKDSGIISIVGDCNSKDVIEKVKSYISKSDKVLVIEDSAHTFDNTLKVLQSYSDLVSVGSYLIVEDGICDVIDLGVSPGPKKAVERWMDNNNSYMIDRSRERYILTYNPKGYLKRLS